MSLSFRLCAGLGLMVLLTSHAHAQKKPKLPPANGTVFQLSATEPKWATADVEFRDPTSSKWPNFFYGKSKANGSFTWDDQNAKADFTLSCNSMAQKNGDQSMKVLAELLKDGKTPTVDFTPKSFGPVVKGKDAKGKPQETMEVTGTVKVNAKDASAKGLATWKWSYAKDADRPNMIQLQMALKTKGTDLGLSTPDEIAVTVGAVAYTEFPKK